MSSGEVRTHRLRRCGVLRLQAGRADGGGCPYIFRGGGRRLLFAVSVVFGFDLLSPGIDFCARKGAWAGRNDGVLRQLADHAEGFFETGAADVAHGGVERAENQLTAFDVDGAAQEAVDDFHERDLDSLLVFEQSDVADARVAEHAVVEVAILLSAESRGAATDSGDLDVSASANVWHRVPIQNFLVVEL